MSERAAGAACRHLHGAEPPARLSKRARILISDFIDEDGRMRGDCPVGEIVLDECRRTGRRPPSDIFEALEIFIRRGKLEDTKWIPGWVTALGRDPDEMVAGAARHFRPGSGNSSVVRAPRIGQRASGTGRGRPGGARN